MAEVKNQIIVLEPCSEALQELLKQVAKRGQVEVTTVTGAEEAIETATAFAPCMMVCSILENGHVPRTVTMLKRLEKIIKTGMLKTMVSSLVKNRQLANLITGMGVTDYIEEPAPLRTLHFKANLQLKALDTVRKQMELKKAAQEKIVFKKDGEKTVETEPAVGATAPQAKPALEIDEDTFLFRNSQVKKQGKKFVLEMEGPDPATGEWKQYADNGGREASWRWVTEEMKSAPEAERGNGWVHEGDKPQFDETIGKWKLMSEAPDLSLVKNGKKVASKISTNEKGEVFVAADSQKTIENIVTNRMKAAELRKAKTEKTAKKKNAVPGEVQESPERKAGEAAEEKIPEKPEGSAEAVGIDEAGAAAPEQDSRDSVPEKIRAERESGSPAEENVVSLRDRRSQSDEKGTFADKRAPSEKKALTPLDFLKKKKEEKRKTAAMRDTVAEPGAEEKNEKAGDPAESGATGEKPKKSRAKNVLDALESRMRAGSEALEDLPERESAAELSELEDGASVEEIGPTDEEELSDERKETRGAKSGRESGEQEEDAPHAPTYAEERKKKEKKKAIYKEIQAVLRKPLPEKLTPQEEQELRKKYGFEDVPEIDALGLAKRARSEEIKKLKQRLLDIDLNRDADAEVPDSLLHDLSPEETENTQSDKQLLHEQKHTKVRAFDSGDDFREEEEEERIKARGTKARKGRDEAEQIAEEVAAEQENRESVESTERERAEWDEPAAEPEELAAREDQAETLKSLFQREKRRKERDSEIELHDADAGESEAPNIAEAVSAKLAAESPAIERFLARRKKKERNPEPSESSANQTANPYLGIYVCVSDVLGHPMPPEKAITKLLRSIVQSFEHCEAHILSSEVENDSAVAIFSDGERTKPGDRVSVDDLSFPIPQSAGEGGKILGYLNLRATAPRTEFSAEELSAAKRCVEHFRVLLTRNGNAGEAA